MEAAERLSSYLDDAVAIVGKNKISDFLSKSYTQRVAAVTLCDSNGSMNGFGWNSGLAKSLLNTYGCYGTGIRQLGLHWSGAAGQWKAQANYGNGGFRESGAPPDLDKYATGGLGPEGVGICGYAYLADGDTDSVSASTNLNLTIKSDHPVGVNNNLRFRCSYGTFVTGTPHTFAPAVRQNSGGYTNLVTASSINPITGNYRVVDSYVDLAAATRNYELCWTPTVINGSNAVKGPSLFYYASAENIAATSGLSFQHLVHHSGGSMLTFLNDLKAFGATAIQEYFRQICLTLGTTKSCLIIINGGINDRNETNSSVGPEPVNIGSSPEAYKDNLRGIIKMLQDGWQANGCKLYELHICFVPSHPYDTVDDPKLQLYRQAAVELTQEYKNSSCILIPNICPGKMLNDNSWYDSGGHDHLTATGYDKVGSYIIKSIASKHNSPSEFVGSASLDFSSIAAASSAELTITVNGATIGQTVKLGLPATIPAGLLFDARVTASDTVTVRATNITASAIDPSALTINVKVS